MHYLQCCCFCLHERLAARLSACLELWSHSSVTQGVSGRAAAAGIIAADFSAVPTDSPLRTVGAQRLSTAAQRFQETLLMLLSKMAAPMQ